MGAPSPTYQPQPAQLRTATLTGCPSPIWCEVVECRIYLLRVHNTQIKQHNIHEAALKELQGSKFKLRPKFNDCQVLIHSILLLITQTWGDLHTRSHHCLYAKNCIRDPEVMSGGTNKKWGCVRRWQIYEIRGETMQRKKEKMRRERMRVEW